MIVKKSKHPVHGIKVPINYGYIPDTISDNGEELDTYILGVTHPLETFTGLCIAIIHRLDDEDDKFIDISPGKSFTDEKIRRITIFQEQWFKSKILLK